MQNNNEQIQDPRTNGVAGLSGLPSVEQQEKENQAKINPVLELQDWYKENSQQITQEYLNNALNQNAMNKANLKSGTAERVENYANSRFNTEDTIYQNKLNSWENTLNAKTGSNVFGDAYKTYKSQSTNKYGYQKGELLWQHVDTQIIQLILQEMLFLAL